MTAKIIQLSKYPTDMTADELNAELGDANDAMIIRSLIYAEVSAMRDGRQYDEPRTMRGGIWYDLLKPALSKMGILYKETKESKPEKPKLVDWPQMMSQQLVAMVEGGITTYSELQIVDASRLRSLAHTVANGVVTSQITGDHYPNVIAFIEKDSTYALLSDVASLYGVSCYSGGGQSSAAAVENLVMRIIENGDCNLITLISLTDYDPAGYSIAESFEKHVRWALRGYHIPVRHHRIGLEPNQLDDDIVEVKKYRLKITGKERIKVFKWYSQTGGIDRKLFGLELDAIPNPQIRAMFATGIENAVDITKREQDLRTATLDGLVCRLLLPDFEKKRQALIKQAHDNGLVEYLDGVDIPEDLFRRAARQGLNAIDPLVNNLFDESHIIETLKGYKQGGA